MIALAPLFVGTNQEIVARLEPVEAEADLGTPGVVATTEKETATLDAALYEAFPDWLAVIVHVPASNMVAVVPDTEQIVGVDDEKLTVKPELAVAERVTVALPVCVPGLLKLIV